MVLTLLLALLGGGLDVSSWHAISRGTAFLRLQLMHWDYNQTCIDGQTVEFSGQHPLSIREVRAWNTAVLLAVETGLVPAFISTRRNIC